MNFCCVPIIIDVSVLQKEVHRASVDEKNNNNCDAPLPFPHKPTFCFFNHDNGLAAALGDYSNWNTHESVSSLIAQGRGQKAAVCFVLRGLLFAGNREFRRAFKWARALLSLRQNRPARSLVLIFYQLVSAGSSFAESTPRTKKYKCGAGVFCFLLPWRVV